VTLSIKNSTVSTYECNFSVISVELSQSLLFYWLVVIVEIRYWILFPIHKKQTMVIASIKGNQKNESKLMYDAALFVAFTI